MALTRLVGWIIRGRQETCEACQDTFTCGPLGSCWCAKEQVSPEALQELKKTYHRCLCPSCLRKAAASDTDR